MGRAFCVRNYFASSIAEIKFCQQILYPHE